MNLATFGFVITGVFLNALAQLLLKKGTNNIGAIHLTLDTLFSTGLKMATQLPILGGLSCYVLSVVLWIVALSRVEVSVAYPMVSLGYVVTALGAWYFLGEQISLQRVVAMAVILAGVALLARS